MGGEGDTQKDRQRDKEIHTETETHNTHTERERERHTWRVGPGYKTLLLPSDILPPARLYHLKVPKPPPIVPPGSKC